MTLAISLPMLIGLGLSFLLFIAVSVLAVRQGLFDGGGYSDLSQISVVFFYIFLWLVPSLLGWAAYATWWK